MSTDEDVIATLKIHAETEELVEKHEADTLAGHLKALYNRFHGGVVADWTWIAHFFKREANDSATAKPDENAATTGKTAGAAGAASSVEDDPPPGASKK